MIVRCQVETALVSVLSKLTTTVVTIEEASTVARCGSVCVHTSCNREVVVDVEEDQKGCRDSSPWRVAAARRLPIWGSRCCCKTSLCSWPRYGVSVRFVDMGGVLSGSQGSIVVFLLELISPTLLLGGW